jgi:lysophospholipase L1-like esterase
LSTRSLILLVALIGGAELCGRGHAANQPLAFHAGAWLLAGALLLATQRCGRALRGAAAALALLLAGLSLLALLQRGSGGAPPEPSASYEASGGNPEALARWWEAHERERAVLAGETALVPGQRFSLFDTEVELDANGLRRADAPPEGAFRILVLGGSAAFDTPERRDERTWPEQLEAAIAADYACARPVSVRNAAHPGSTLEELSLRFDAEIAPHRPDLLLVYPGADVLRALPPPAGALPASRTPERVSGVLRALERRVRERAAAERLQGALAEEPDPELLRRAPAARSYRRLLVAARTHGVDAALVTPALAVNGGSADAAIRFHEAVWPDARRLIVARRNHARLLPLLGASYRAAGLDVAEGLDGDVDSFLDLVHLSARGRERLVQNLSRALGPLLARERPGCSRRP